MRANELRIGDIISHEKCPFFRVDEIHITPHHGNVARMYPFLGTGANYGLESYMDLTISDAQPIPLTEEILKDWCGFKHDTDGYACGKHNTSDAAFSGKIDVSRQGDRFYLWLDCEDCFYSQSGIEIQSLHQLQNLYFALTGEELEVMLPTQ